MSAAVAAWRPVYDADETVEQFTARQRHAFAAFELAWREGRISIKLKGYYDQLVRDVGANAYAWWTEERWAEAFGVSASTIKRVLGALTTAGLIRRERQFGASSRTFLTVYDRLAECVVADAANYTDRQLPHPPATQLPVQHDITKSEEQAEQGRAPNHQPAAPQEGGKENDHRQDARSFFGAMSDPTIGSLLRRDHVKTRHLTVGAAGKYAPASAADPLARQVLDREGVADFVLAPQLAKQAAGELEAVSRYLDTQAAVRDRPRLFAWLASHGFGRHLLAGRNARPPASTRHQRAQPRSTPPARPTPRVERQPTAQTAFWTQVCAQLQNDAGTSALAPWLTDTMLLELTDTAAVIGTPNVFVRDAVGAEAAAVAAVIAAVAGRAVAVEVVVDGWH